MMMPKMDGISTCKEIRKKDELKNTLVTFLTARDEDYTQIAGFEAGADDYITKPIKPKVFISRIRGLMRRLDTKSEQKIVYVADLEINKERYAVIRNGEDIILARKEFELLCLLASKPGRVFKRDEIMHKVWSNDTIVGDRTIDVHVRKLRERLGRDYFRTVKGIGYKFDA
jgi:two-component system alkaline phosphatase synthesis response regulator PhoP